MKNGTCPYCKANTVFKKRQGISFSSDSGFYVAIAKDWVIKSISEVDYYLCTTCGHMEIYVDDKDKLAAVAKDWERVL